jgi:hypothetical protein
MHVSLSGCPSDFRSINLHVTCCLGAFKHYFLGPSLCFPAAWACCAATCPLCWRWRAPTQFAMRFDWAIGTPRCHVSYGVILSLSPRWQLHLHTPAAPCNLSAPSSRHCVMTFSTTSGFWAIEMPNWQTWSARLQRLQQRLPSATGSSQNCVRLMTRRMLVGIAHLDCNGRLCVCKGIEPRRDAQPA